MAKRIREGTFPPVPPPAANWDDAAIRVEQIAQRQLAERNRQEKNPILLTSFQVQYEAYINAKQLTMLTNLGNSQQQGNQQHNMPNMTFEEALRMQRGTNAIYHFPAPTHGPQPATFNPNHPPPTVNPTNWAQQAIHELLASGLNPNIPPQAPHPMAQQPIPANGANPLTSRQIQQTVGEVLRRHLILMANCDPQNPPLGETMHMNMNTGFPEMPSINFRCQRCTVFSHDLASTYQMLYGLYLRGEVELRDFIASQDRTVPRNPRD